MEITPKLIDEIRDYINSFEETDQAIEELILEAEAYIITTAGESWRGDEKKERLAKLLLKKLCADIYDNRGTQTTQVFKKDKVGSTILEVLSLGGDT